MQGATSCSETCQTSNCFTHPKEKDFDATTFYHFDTNDDFVLNHLIIMSQGFVDSMWCKEEFTHCYIENMKDAAFNLFVIMMQPADTLVNISPYMKTFFSSKTYLDVNDPDLFTKLAAHLKNARQSEDDVNNYNNENS